MKKFLTYAFIAAIMTIVVLSIAVRNLSGEKERLAANQAALLADVEYYKTENGRNAASVQELTLTYDELKRNYDDVCKTAKELGIKVKRMESAATTATETDMNVTVPVHDTIVYVRDVPVPATAFTWRDSWTDVVGCIRRDSVDLNVQTRDTLVQIVHREPHRFWFIKWGCKAIRQEIVSKNPHTKITYSEYIELKK